MFLYAFEMAAVFITSASTLAIRIRFIRRGLAALGDALLLLIRVGRVTQPIMSIFQHDRL
jgi:hypothetical protein